MITVRLQMLRQTKGSHQTQDRLAVGMVDDPTLQVMILCDTTIHTAIHTMTLSMRPLSIASYICPCAADLGVGLGRHGWGGAR